MKFRVWFDNDGDEPGYSLELKKGRAGWSVTREEMNIGGARIRVDEEQAFEHPTESLNLESATGLASRVCAAIATQASS